ncbi:MAG: hypothetical protein L6V80_07425 [Bacteroidales bacterium]|nr:MAG: hypothetical protein L6V80_07425 [Bacteroidales bacterium]
MEKVQNRPFTDILHIIGIWPLFEFFLALGVKQYFERVSHEIYIQYLYSNSKIPPPGTLQAPEQIVTQIYGVIPSGIRRVTPNSTATVGNDDGRAVEGLWRHICFFILKY